MAAARVAGVVFIGSCGFGFAEPLGGFRRGSKRAHVKPVCGARLLRVKFVGLLGPEASRRNDTEFVKER